MSSCLNCCHYIPLTEKEKKVIVDLLGSYGEKFQQCLGVCIGSDMNPKFFLQKIIFNSEFDCDSHMSGESRDTLNLLCPVCRSGILVMSRSSENGKSNDQNFTCSHQKECGYRSNEVVLRNTCRFCGEKLILISGEIITVQCRNCQKPVQLPISLKIFPAIAFPMGGCSHTQTLKECNTCQKSRDTKKSLLELEKDWIQSLLIYASKESRIVNREIQKVQQETTQKPKTSYPKKREFRKYRTNVSRPDGHVDNYVEGWNYSYNDYHRAIEEDREDYDSFRRDWWNLTDEEQGGNSFI